MGARRGGALASVLGLVVLLLLICVMVATLSVTNLNFARGFREAVQAELLARAAMAQFMADQDLPTGSALEPGARPSLAERYPGGSIFPDGASRLDGTVELTFDSSQPYYSLDNSQSESPAAGWADRGTDDRSVCPFGVDLVLKVTCARKVSYYEAVLRRRWPYVLATHGNVGFVDQSHVKGDLLVYPARIRQPSDPLPSYEMATKVSRDEYDRILTYNSLPRVGVVAVGSPSNDLRQGNTYEGHADFVGDRVENGMMQLVVPLPGNTAIPMPRNDSYNFPGTLPPDGLGRRKSLLDQLLQQPGPSGEELRPPNSPTNLSNSGVPYWLLQNDLFLAGNDDNIPTFTRPTDVLLGDSFVVSGSLGNHFSPDSGPAPLNSATGAGIFLRDTTLFVTHNLDLRKLETADGTETVPALRGSNATLIVGGALVLDDGALDAVDRSMVIYANSLVFKAQGNYRGLIMVREGAVFYPGESGGMTIEGGVLCNALPSYIARLQDEPGAPPDPADVPFEVRGLTLFATTLKYNPAYLKSIHAFGKFEPVLLRKL